VYGKYIVRHAKNIRVVSERIKTGLLTLGVLPRAITVLPIYADLKQFLAVGAVRNYQVSDTVRFLYVGRFAAEKNIPLLLAAFAAVAKKYPFAQLTLLGAGPEGAAFKALVKEYQITTRVTFLPWADDVAAVMAHHDVFCLASNHEGWGMVLLEAAATGMPIITTDVGCAGTCVVHNENGYIVPVEHQSEFEAAMEQYCSTPRLVATQGVASYHLARQQALSETEYELKVVDSLTSCVP
jgi:glycosyltransferase involved in cell wall biosynthesis